MARSFTAKEAKQLVQEHQSLFRLLEEDSRYAERQKENTCAMARNLLARNQFADYASGALLSGNAGLSLPTDIQQMILCMDKYLRSAPLSEESKKLYDSVQRSIESAIAELKPGTNGLQWIFTSGAKKEQAIRAYDYLKEAQNGAYAWQVQALDKDIGEIDRQTNNDTLKKFDAERSVYQETAFSLMPSLGKGSDSIREIIQLCNEHESILRQLEATQGIIDSLCEQIRNATERMAVSQALKLLKDIPIEELGREKTGIRFKLLRDCGYQTVSDVYCATIYNLASVRGISEDTAHTLKQQAKQYAKQVQSGAKIRLSADDKSPEATKLILAICKYRRLLDTIHAVDDLKRQYGGIIDRGLTDMHGIGNGVSWLFADTSERERLIESYQTLNELGHGSYSQTADELSRQLSNPVYISPVEAWDDFERNTVSYFNVLEDIVPGVLGNDDSLYGLPEELAREIQEECFFPDGLKCELRRYQEWGVKYILHQERVLLGDEMGLGKTVQAIATMVSLRNTGATHFMVVCPASVLPNWCKEIAEKSKLRVTKIHGQGRTEAFQSWQKIGGAAVTTFETTGYLHMDADERFDLMIVDEAHYIKNSEARRTVNVKRLGEHAKRMLFMTGTALENNVDEMIALIQILQPSIASQLHSIAFMSSAPQFREKVAPVYYRRKRENVLTELPELIENEEWCTLSAQEEAEYERSLYRKNYADVRRVSWNMDDLSQSCKAARMKEIIEEAEANGRKTIVFSFFLDTMRKVGAFLGERCMPPINGSVPPQRRQEIIDEFDRAPAGSVLLAQIQSGGTGLNIQSASVVIICEPQLKPSIENQAISRAYRMGQARNVLVYRLLCEETIDERITDLLAQKQEIFDAFADKSTAAAATEKEEIALDDKTLGKLVKEEIERINAKNTKKAGKPEGALSSVGA